MSKLGDKLNFNSMKSSAMDTKSVTSHIPPRSGVEFASGSVIEFELSGNREREFLDVNNNMKIKLPVKYVGAGTLDRCAAYGFISKIEFIQNGTVLTSVSKYNVLMTALTDLQMSTDYRGSQGRLLEGFEADSLRGEIVTTGTTRTYYLSPLACDLAMTTPHRSLYLGSSANIVIRLTLESDAVALQHNSGTPSYSVVKPELIIDSTFLERDTMDALNKAVGGSYNMLCNSYDHMSAIVQAGTTSSHIKLSFAKASLERILFTVRPLGHTTDTSKFSLGSRGTGNMSQFQLEVSGVDYPQQPIKVEGDGAEAMYHLLKSDNIASNYSHGVVSLMNSYSVAGNFGTSSVGSFPSIKKVNPYSIPGRGVDGDSYGDSSVVPPLPSNIGTFMGAINLESNLTTSQNSPLYSGVNTKNGVDVYFKCDWGSGCISEGVVIDFYSLSSELIYLEKDTNLWARKN